MAQTFSRITHPMMIVGAGNALSKVMMFIATVWIANTVREEAFGAVMVGFTIVNYFAVFGFAGVDTVTTREAAHRSPAQRASLASEVILIRTLISLLLCACTLACAYAMRSTAGRMTHLYAWTLLPQAINTVFLFYGVEWSRPVMMYFIGGRIVYLCGVLLWVRGPEDALYVPVVFGIALVAEHIYLCIQWARRYAFRVTRLTRRTLRRWLPALPITISASGLLLHENAALILLYFLRGSADAGLYAASYKLVYVALSLATLLSYVYLARATRAVRANSRMAQRHFIYFCSICGIAGFVCAICGSILAPWIIGMLYRPEYTMSAALLSIGIWQMVLAPIRIVSFQMINACHGQRAAVRVIWFSALMSVAAICLGIWLWGAIGAAYGTVVGEACVAGFLFISARRAIAATVHHDSRSTLATQDVV